MVQFPFVHFSCFVYVCLLSLDPYSDLSFEINFLEKTLCCCLALRVMFDHKMSVNMAYIVVQHEGSMIFKGIHVHGYVHVFYCCSEVMIVGRILGVVAFQ